MRIASTALLILIAISSAGASTYTVHPNGSGDFPTIQEALDEIVTGDVILLGDGTFTGPGNRNLNTLNTDVTIRSISDDPGLCIIDCQGSSGTPYYGIEFDNQTSTTVLRGITITGGYSAVQGGAVIITDASPQILNCMFIGNYAYNFGGAVHCSNPSTPYFQDCLFDGNIADYYGQGGAVFLSEECSAEFENCTFISNTASDGSGIFANLESNPIVRQCTFWNNNAQVIKAGEDSQVLVQNSILAFNTGSAVACFSNGLVWVECSDIFGNPGGNWTGCITGLDGILGNLEENPFMCNPAGGDYTLHSVSPCAPDNSGTCGLIGAWPVGCWNIITVDADGTGDYPTIQAAVDAAVGDGTEIIELLDGVYSGEGNYDVSFLGKALTIRSQSGNAEACIINPNPNSSMSRRAFLFENEEGSDSVLENLTFTKCREAYGAAVYAYSAGPTINNCIFKDNVSSSGALYYQSYDAEDELSVSGCLFIGNSSSGDYAFGAAFSCTGFSAYAFSDCQFIDNAVDAVNGYGGAISGGNTPGSYTRCTFARNSASLYGGAIICSDGDFPLVFENCTFTGNSAPDGSVIYNQLSDVVFQNSIIAFNGGGPCVVNDEVNNQLGTITLSCTDIFGNEGGDWVPDIADQFGISGNITADPQFCDSRFDDFSLTASSPCAPFSPPNQYCELLGAWPVGCDYSGAITSIEDVAGDQGRHVRVAWARSPQDGYGTPYDVTAYSLWRRIDTRAAGSSNSEEASARENRYPPGDWDYVTTIPARAEASYNVVAETLCDSSIVDGLCLSSFFVSAETTEHLVFFDSETASGYSVDNLAPGVPLNLHFETTALLAWDESSDNDFDYFSVYGSQVDVMDETALLIDNTSATDLDVSASSYPFYLVTTVDFSGNESGAAIIAGEETAIGDFIPTKFALYLSSPNPVHDRTTIRFDLPEDCRVSIAIYDVAGRRVSTLIKDHLPAGSHSVQWSVKGDQGRRPVSSGGYFYRMEAADFQQTGRVLVLK